MMKLSEKILPLSFRVSRGGEVRTSRFSVVALKPDLIWQSKKKSVHQQNSADQSRKFVELSANDPLKVCASSSLRAGWKTLTLFHQWPLAFLDIWAMT